MSTDANAPQQQMKQKEFMGILPLTFEIAGLPKCEVGRHFTLDQMDVRATTLKNAYKVARQLLLDVSK
jgi:hypothetical protein